MPDAGSLPRQINGFFNAIFFCFVDTDWHVFMSTTCCSFRGVSFQATLAFGKARQEVHLLFDLNYGSSSAATSRHNRPLYC